jgi:hypothetical protein
MAYQDPMASTGLWIPNLQINGSSAGITYSTQTGGFTQIGNVVLISCNIVLSSKGASAGNVTISNLPIKSGTNASDNAIPVNFFNAWTLTSYTSLSVQVSSNSTIGTFIASGEGQGVINVTNTQLSNTFAVIFSGFYIAD